MPPPLGGGVLHSFFFTAVRPIGLGSSFIFLHCRSPHRGWGFIHFYSLPRRKTNQKEGGSRAGKELGLWPQTAFPEAGDIENGIFTIRKVQRIHAHKAGRRIRATTSKQLLPRRETQKTASSQSARYKGYMHTKPGEESGPRPQTASPEAGDIENGIFTIHKVQRIYARKAGKRIRPMASECVS